MVSGLEPAVISAAVPALTAKYAVMPRQTAVHADLPPFRVAGRARGKSAVAAAPTGSALS
jgi:hypothetical protein